MSLPPPAADQAYCEISAIDSGRIQMLLGQLVDAATVVGFGFIATGFLLVKRATIRSEFDHLVARFSGE